MKTIIVFLSLICLTSGKAEFDWKGELTHDFGTITMDVPVTHTFEFTNTGEEPLVIVNAKGSCGCTVPSYTETPIQPGDTGEVKVTYDAARAGTFRKSVTLTANTQDETVILYVTGEVN